MLTPEPSAYERFVEQVGVVGFEGSCAIMAEVFGITEEAARAAVLDSLMHDPSPGWRGLRSGKTWTSTMRLVGDATRRAYETQEAAGRLLDRRGLAGLGWKLAAPLVAP